MSREGTPRPMSRRMRPAALCLVLLLATGVLAFALAFAGCKGKSPDEKTANKFAPEVAGKTVGKTTIRPKTTVTPKPAMTAKPSETPNKTPVASSQPSPLASTGSLDKPVAILVAGTDASAALTDVNLLLYLNPASGRTDALWVPRDTRVNLPRYGFRKINAAHALGGIALLKSSIARLTGISPQYYVRVDFQGFKLLIDLIGGVELNVGKAMRYRDRRGGLDIDLKPGFQRLGGQNALEYVRFRADGQGDLGRIGRQKLFVVALFDEVVSHRQATLSLLPKLLASVETDLPEPLARALLERYAVKGSLTPDSLHVLPGEARYIGRVSYFVPNQEQVALLMARIRG